MRTRYLKWILALGAAGLVLGAVGLARTAPGLSETMPKLAKDFTFPQSKDSPGKVTFSHSSHIDEKRPDCTGCHPGQWKMLEPGQTADGRPHKHERMDKGELCGSCHDGKKAFAIKDCDTCHSSK